MPTAQKPFLFKHLPLWFTGFLLLIALCPLPFGANRPWASDLLAALVGLFLLLAALAQPPLLRFSQEAPQKRLALAASALLLVVLWSIFQTVSWTPTAWHHPIWKEAEGLLGPVRGTISVDPSLFYESLARLLSYIGCFLLALQATRNPDHAKIMVRVLAYAGAAYAAYGLLAQSMGSNTILWYKKWAYEGFLTSTFVNKNSYAAFAGLGLLCCITVLRDRFHKVKIQDEVIAQKSRWVALLSSLQTKDYLAFLPLLTILAALALTGSRAGITSTFIGVLGYVLALAVHKRLKAKQWSLLLGGGLIVFVGFVALGGEALLSRMDQSQVASDAETRMAGYELVGIAISDNPWLGFGLGTFDSAFKLYRDNRLPLWYHHAHNDYLEMVMDLGIPAALLLFLAIGLMVSCCVTGLWARRKGSGFLALAIGASSLVAAHAFVDFSLHIPAIAATYATILGLGVAQSWPTRKKPEEAATKKR